MVLSLGDVPGIVSQIGRLHKQGRCSWFGLAVRSINRDQ